VPPDVAAAFISLWVLGKLLEEQIALEAWTERGVIMGGFNGRLAPLDIPPEAARLHRLQRQQRERLERQGPILAKRRQAQARRPQRRREPRAASRVRRQRATSATRRGPPSEDSQPPGGDEPPLVSVTVSRSCVVCDGELEGRRQQTAYCSNACRQRAYRQRRKTVTRSAPIRISFELYKRLEVEANRRRRARIEDLRQREAVAA
jgi:hypothetical protein